MVYVLQDLYLDDYFDQITMDNKILNYQKNNITSLRPKRILQHVNIGTFGGHKKEKNIAT
jgi:FMN-dependent NADH-azoreductase